MANPRRILMIGRAGHRLLKRRTGAWPDTPAEDATQPDVTNPPQHPPTTFTTTSHTLSGESGATNGTAPEHWQRRRPAYPIPEPEDLPWQVVLWDERDNGYNEKI